MKKRAAQPAESKTPDNSHPLEGQEAPHFELPDSHGDPIRLAELLKHGPVILYFYPRDNTPGCTTEACAFRDNMRRVLDQGAQVVGVSTDSVSSHQKFEVKYDLNFPLLSDQDKSVVKSYGVYKKKTLYGRESMGIERSTFIIDRTGMIRKVFPKVKVAGHIEAVLDVLKDF